MKLILAEPKLLKESISIISDLVTEARFKISRDVLELVAMDPANVAMVIFRMPSSSFAEYDIKKDEVIAINLGSLKQVLRRAKGNDVLSLEMSDNKLKVTLKAKSTRTFDLPLIDLEEKEQRVPKLDPKAVIELPSESLNEAVEDIDIVSESISFQADKGKLLVSGTGDLTKAEVVLNHGDGVVIKSSEVHKSKYSIEYLKKMMQGSKLAGKAVLKFSKDYPLTLEYLEKDKVSLTFILAPRVDND